MSALREEELNMINGGNAEKGMLGGAKFNVGDKVISKLAPDGGVGTVEKSKYDKGWWYSVRMQGGLLYTPESDLEPALMVQWNWLYSIGPTMCLSTFAKEDVG